MKKKVINLFKKNNNKPILILLLLGIISTLGIGVTYSMWVMTKTQEKDNKLISMCLDLSFTNANDVEGIDLLNVWPLTTEEAQNEYEGYSFVVTNNCNETLPFYIGAQKLNNDTNSIKDTSISMSIEDGDNMLAISDYDSLTTIDGFDDSKDSAKLLKFETLGPKESKTYTYKMWINETGDIEDANKKEFETKLFVTGGPGIADPEYVKYAEGCFVINGAGSLVGYRVEESDLQGNPCVWSQDQIADSDYAEFYPEDDVLQKFFYVADVKIPEKVAGTEVKKTSINALRINKNSGYKFTVYELEDEEVIIVINNKDSNFYDLMFSLDGGETFLRDENLTYEEYIEYIDESFLDEYTGPYINKAEMTFEELYQANVIASSLDLSSASGLKTIGDRSFMSFVGYGEDLDIPSNVKTIEDGAFLSFSGEKLILHEGLEKIGSFAFAENCDTDYCNYLSVGEGYVGSGQDLVIPDSVKEIGSGAFRFYNGSHLDLGHGIYSLGGSAFKSYEGIDQTLIIPRTIKKYIRYKEYCEYCGADGQFSSFNGKNLIIENGLEEIAESMFSRYNGADVTTYFSNGLPMKKYTNKRELIIPDSVTKIDSYAFSSFNGSNITFGKNLAIIGNSAFNSYYGTNESLKFPSSLKTIGNRSFYNFSGSGLVFSEGLQSISYYAFSNYVGSGQDLILPNSLTSIGGEFGGTFSRFNGKKLVLGNSLKEIKENDFSSYVGTGEELIIPSSVEIIGESSFYSFNGSKLILNEGLQTIYTAFSNYVGSDQDLIIPNSVEMIDSGAFYDFNGDNLILGNGLSKVNQGVFYSYEGIGKNLTIPNNITQIDNSAFCSFKGNNLTLSSNLIEIGSSAFYRYTNNINVNRTENEWNNAISSNNLLLHSGWKNDNATLVFK